MKLTQASTGKLISKSKFSGYDHCLNTYVGCEHACLFCYVPQFLQGDAPWGEWVRMRSHLPKKLLAELDKLGSTRLVLGTMSDPYQPTEKVEKLTQKALHIIRQARRPMKKVGIFTRSPLVLRDIDLIVKLPRGRVHFTASPYDEQTREKLEPVSAPMHERWEAIRQLKAAGIRVHVNVAPFIPIASEYFIDDFAGMLADLKVDEFYIDPMQCYSAAMKRIAADPPHSEWSKIEAIMGDRAAYKAWKKELHIKWTEAWKKVAHLSPDTMALSCDHENKMKVDMSTGEWLDWKQYDEYEMRK